MSTQLRTQSIVCCVFYTIMSVVCWFFFYHHPQHIGIVIRRTKGNEYNFGFNVDTTTIYNPKPIASGPGAGGNSGSDILNLGGDENMASNNAIGNSSEGDKINSKLDVTLIDAFRIRELNLLIISYIFRETHDAFIKQTF